MGGELLKEGKFTYFKKDSPSLATILILFFIAMLVVSFIYELVKEILYPSITIWESHTVTILFTSIVSVVILFFPLRNLYQEQEKTKAVLMHQHEAERTQAIGSPGAYLCRIGRRFDLYGSPGPPVSSHQCTAPRTASASHRGSISEKHTVSYIHQKRPRPLKRRSGRLLERKRPCSIEYQREGKYYHRKLNPVIEPADNTVIAVTVISTDITDRKRAEEELKLFKASVDGASDEVFWLDFEGNIIYVNEAACRLTGYQGRNSLA